VSRADLGKDPEEVAAMFDGVARRYDLFNDLLSLGATKRWRRRVEKMIDPKPGMKFLILQLALVHRVKVYIKQEPMSLHLIFQKEC